ncbi:MAG: chemotaxis protein CheW [Kofleriaceae bacterium]
MLIARVGTLTCAIPVEHVVETMRPLPVEPLGQAAAYVRGIAVIRGAPTLVIDAAALFETTAGAGARFVVIRAASRTAALLVDAVSEVRAIARAELQALPPLARAATSDVIAAIGAVDSELVVVLEAAKLVTAWT